MKNAFPGLLLLFAPVVCRAQPPAAQEKDATTELQICQAVGVMEKGETAESRLILTSMPAESPGHAVARYEMAYSYLLDKDYAKALEELEAIPGPESLGWRYYQLAGSLHDYLGQPDKTLEAFDKGLELYSRSGMLHPERGMMRQRRQQLDEALEDYGELYFNQAASEAGVTSVGGTDFAAFCAIRKRQLLALNAQSKGPRPHIPLFFPLRRATTRRSFS